MRILAIDPGYARVGIAVLEKNAGKESLLFSECYETDAKTDQANRLAAIQKRIREVIDRFKPQALAIESLFFSKNQKTALAVAEARGTITALAAGLGLAVFEYKPAAVKVAVTGYGQSDKTHIKDMIKKILSLEKTIKLDDEYDAIAVGLTHLATYREQN
jgi:crossover junction endodeoxyribonuclease RuvC